MLRAEGLTKRFRARTGDVTAFEGVDLIATPDRPLVVTGASGAGKTTLLRILAGLEREDFGSVLLDGEPIAMRERLDLAAFAHHSAALWPHRRVRQQTRVNTKMNESNSDAVIDALDLRDLLDRRPQELSGGQQLRVAVARALLSERTVLLLDEPLAHLDEARRADLVDVIMSMQQRLGRIVVITSHDLAAFADRSIDRLELRTTAGAVGMR
ncbi:MAG: ATP-binding cassette domain-containing protein [Planctomycetota bacterium]